MAHLHRFFHESLPDVAREISLSREESHHAMRVLRVRQGDEVVLFNGVGLEWRGAVAFLSRNEVKITLESQRALPKPVPRVTLAQAWLHRDKINDEIVRQATVLGATDIVFFRGDHSEKTPKLSEKWSRLTIESCKQCGRLWLPKLSVAENLDAVLKNSDGGQRIMARMEGPHVPVADAAIGDSLTLIVGPEGDFSEAELALAEDAGALPITLGDHTFRAEMAAMVGLTLLQHHAGHIG